MARKKHRTEDDFFEIPKYSGFGIYAIVSVEDFKCYVGSTSNIKNRAYQHKTSLKAGTHINKGLQKAHDDKKILRFIILQKVDSGIDKDIILLLEYFYMLQMRYKCFGLYNEIPKSGNYRKQDEVLKAHILGRISRILRASENIESALEKECGSKSGYLRNAKYREWSAKHEIKSN